MATAIILSGGFGKRLQSDIPKQYIYVNSIPVISYCIRQFEDNKDIDNIVIVADISWEEFITQQLQKMKCRKFYAFAPPGKTRQHSVLNGLKAAKNCTDDNDVVIIHDGARPLVSNKLISECVRNARLRGGAMPVINVKDTIYKSCSKERIDTLLNRNELFAGQTPEGFLFGRYYKINTDATDSELSYTNGSSMIAFKNGIDVALFPGDEGNFKITTKEDLSAFETIIKNKKD